MGAFGAFLLLISAFVGTLILVTDPNQRIFRWAQGKTRNEADKAIEEWVKQNSLGRIFGLGCGYLLFMIVALGYVFIVEPMAVVSAIVYNIGNQMIAYLMLTITVVAWFRSAHAIMNIGRKIKATVITEDGQEIEGVVMNPPLDLPDHTWMQVRRVIFALPTLYLWYLFFTVIGVL